MKTAKIYDDLNNCLVLLVKFFVGSSAIEQRRNSQAGIPMTTMLVPNFEKYLQFQRYRLPLKNMAEDMHRNTHVYNALNLYIHIYCQGWIYFTQRMENLSEYFKHTHIESIARPKNIRG